MKEAVVVSGARTAIEAFGDSLKDVSAVNLGSVVIKEALKRAGLRPKFGQTTVLVRAKAGETMSKVIRKLTRKIGS